VRCSEVCHSQSISYTTIPPSQLNSASLPSASLPYTNSRATVTQTLHHHRANTNTYPSIVDACVSGYQSRIDACQKNGNDFICLCDVYTDVLVCYNNCPNSLEKPPVANTVTSYCGAAAPLRGAASASAASVASVAATQSHAVASSTGAAKNAAATSGSVSGSAAAPTASSFQGGAEKMVPAGAAVVALLGAIGLF
jgi:hypothetical protein